MSRLMYKTAGQGYAKIATLLLLAALCFAFIDESEPRELNIVERCISMDGFTELSEECSEFVKFLKSEGVKI